MHDVHLLQQIQDSELVNNVHLLQHIQDSELVNNVHLLRHIQDSELVRELQRQTHHGPFGSVRLTMDLLVTSNSPWSSR